MTQPAKKFQLARPAMILFTCLAALSFSTLLVTHTPSPIPSALNSRRLSEFESPSEQQMQQIISASTNLISLEFLPHHTVTNDSYSGIIGVFCPLDFEKQKQNPSKVPMFRDLVDASGCAEEDKELIRVDLKSVVEIAKAHDVKLFQSFHSDISNDMEGPSVLSLTGAVFHESRCGSTLVSNALMALNPEKHRVYSEAGPPKQVLKMCDETFSKCSVSAAANLLRDVIYLMGRSNDPMEENMFFKFQSATTTRMQVFRMAFPTTPWIFLYRDPVEVMMSQLDMADLSQANCVRTVRQSPMVKHLAKILKLKMKNLEDEEICALHLATISGAAVVNLKDAGGLGLGINYHDDMAYVMLDYVFPIHFRTPVDKEGYQKVLDISKVYSKSTEDEQEIFEPDTNRKKAKASSAIKEAAMELLDPSYKNLEKSEYNINKICEQVNLDAGVAEMHCRSRRRIKH